MSEEANRQENGGFDEIMKQVSEVVPSVKKDMEDIVHEADEKEKAEAAAKEKKPLEAETKSGLIRSRIAATPNPVPATDESMDDYKDRLEFSYHHMNVDRDDVWDKLKSMKDEKTVITGEVIQATKGGCVMEVEGVQGFIPASKLSLTYVADTAEFLHKELDVQIIECDPEASRLVLSAKELLYQKQREEKKNAVARITVGSIFTGTVDSLKDYGAFVDLGNGVSGLLHISQISKNRVNNIRSVLKEGQEVTVQIIKVADGKISLSMRSLREDEEKAEAEEEPKSYKDKGEATTSLGDLLKGLKF